MLIFWICSAGKKPAKDSKHLRLYLTSEHSHDFMWFTKSGVFMKLISSIKSSIYISSHFSM